MATPEATIHSFPSQVRTCNYCKRRIDTNTIVANNAAYCGKLCAAVGLIAEVHEEDGICEEHSYALSERVIESVFYDVPVRIPVKVRWSDALEFDEEAPEGFEFQIIPIDDEGIPDWIPPGGKQLIVSDDEIDRVVDDLLRNGDESEGRL